jgi:hypothetical protein
VPSGEHDHDVAAAEDRARRPHCLGVGLAAAYRKGAELGE